MEPKERVDSAVISIFRRNSLTATGTISGLEKES